MKMKWICSNKKITLKRGVSNNEHISFFNAKNTHKRGFNHMNDQNTNKEERKILYTIVDANGVIVDYIYEGDKVKHQDEKNPLDEKYFGFNKDKNFVKLYSGISELKKRLTDREFAVAIALSDFVCYDDCCLREGGHGNGSILTMKDLAEKLDMTYDNIKKILLSLRKKKILGIFLTGKNDKTITVNPYIFTRGNNVNKTVITYFENSEWQDLLGKL